MKLKLLEDRLEKLEKLEGQYEEEVKARKALEKKTAELQQQLDEQKKVNETQEQRLAYLEQQMEALLAKKQKKGFFSQ